MKEPLNRTLDGKQYAFYQFPVREGLKVLFSLAKIMGEPLGILAKDIAQEKDLQSFLNKEILEVLKGLSIDKIINSLMRNLDEVKTVAIIEILLKQATYKGAPVNEAMDALFADDYMHLAKVLKVTVEVQYGNFFKDIRGLQKLSDLASTPESSTSTG